MQKLNIFTCCNGQYLDFIPLFIFSNLYHNSDAFVEVGYDGELSQELLNSIEYLHRIYNNKFLVREVIVGKILYKNNYIKCSPNLNRFIETPMVKSEYVYISDIDIICLKENILDIHILDMNRTGLPYSNIVRKNETNINYRLTGLHFTSWNNYYPIPNYDKLIQNKTHNHDECFLYEIVKIRYPDFDYENIFRPVHGIHISPNRNPLDKIGWGIDTWSSDQLKFRKDSKFKELESILPISVRHKLSIIDESISYKQKKNT